MVSRHSKVLIIGSGPAGYSAAVYAGRSDLEPLVLAGDNPGGQLMITTEVENYPGFGDHIQGPELMDAMRKHAEKMGAEVLAVHVESLTYENDIFSCTGNDGNQYTADAVILATGASAKWLGIPGEEEYRGYGVSGCAVCDAFFFKNKHVVVIGGGNTAAEEALYLTRHVAKVTVVHRREELRAEPILQERMKQNSKIEFCFDTVVEEIKGESEPTKRVTGVMLKNLKSGKVELLSGIEAVFVAIGHHPNSDLVKDIVKIDQHGYVVARPDSTVTDTKGLFAAGDVKDSVYRQAVTAAGSGCMAALDAYHYLLSVEKA